MADDFKCLACKKTFANHRSLGSHMGQCKEVLALQKKKKTKRPRASHIDTVHSTVKHRKQRRAQVIQKQSRATYYSTTCSWNPLSRSAAASYQISKENVEGACSAIDSDDTIHDDNSAHSGLNRREELSESFEYDHDAHEDSDPLFTHEDDDGWEDVDANNEDTFDSSHSSTPSAKAYAEEKWTAFLIGDGIRDGGTSEWTPTFQYKDNLPPYYIALVSLLHLLSQHKTNDLNIFDRIVQWVSHFSDKYPDIWKTRKQYASHTRKALIPFLAGFF